MRAVRQGLDQRGRPTLGPMIRTLTRRGSRAALLALVGLWLLPATASAHTLTGR